MKLKRGIIEKRQQLLDEVELHLKQTQDLNNKLHQLLLQLKEKHVGNQKLCEEVNNTWNEQI